MTDRQRVDAADLDNVLRLQIPHRETRPPLGGLLVAQGLLTAEQLESALAEVESSGRRLGEVLVARGLVSTRDVAIALARQSELAFLDLNEVEIDPNAAGLLPEKLARRYRALPIYFGGDSLVVCGVVDPTDVATADDLRLALGMSVQFAVVEADAFDRTLKRAHPQALHVTQHAPDDQPVDREAATNAPAIALVNQIIGKALHENASDVHFEPQAGDLLVRARVDGVMRTLTTVSKEMQPAVIGRLKIMAELDIAERRAPQDGRLSVRVDDQPLDIRVAVIPTTWGEQVVLRILHRRTGRFSLGDLGMSPANQETFARAIRQPYGAVIACGPTGSGKTTTLYAALDHLNDAERVLTTIEDPVEYQIPGVNQIEVNVRAGLTFARGLRTILRSDPDVLLVGEIRDEETAHIAIQAAMTGHLVLTTLHTHNAASSIERLKDMGVEPSLLASSVNCIVAQRLARRLCLECRQAYAATETDYADIGLPPDAWPNLTLYRAGGCGRCSGTGYRGRVALYEVMPVQGTIRRLIGGSTDEIFAAAVEQGMTTLRQDGIRLVLDGVSSVDEIRRVTGDRLA
jgi:type IV pilus assembly protein PilB